MSPVRGRLVSRSLVFCIGGRLPLSWLGNVNPDHTRNKGSCEAASARKQTMVENSELRKAGLKVTLPRVKILQMLDSTEQRHMSAEDVYEALMEAEIGRASGRERVCQDG